MRLPVTTESLLALDLTSGRDAADRATKGGDSGQNCRLPTPITALRTCLQARGPHSSHVSVGHNSCQRGQRERLCEAKMSYLMAGLQRLSYS